MTQQRRTTIADVARIAGVSKTTVSRFLNGQYDQMRPETSGRISQTIEKLGFRPNLIARSLTNRTTHTVGLLISDVENPYYGEVIRGVETEGLAHDYRVLLCNTDYDLGRGFHFVDSLADSQVDGLLVMTSRMDASFVQRIVDQRVPSVIWEWPDPGPGIIGLLGLDYLQGIDEAVDHLVGLGHRRIAHISGTPGLGTTEGRVAAYRTAMARRQLSAFDMVAEGDFKVDGGRRAMEQLLAATDRPTAVVAANDLTAIGALQAIKDQKLRVPGDISLVGLDDIRFAALTDPRLSTIALPRFEIGRTAMQILLQHLEGASDGSSDCKRIIFETHLVVRESTGPAPGVAG